MKEFTYGGQTSTGFGRILMYLVVATFTFQAVHFIEHFAQLGYWLVHPSEGPWLTPWAALGRDVLTVRGRAEVGNEVLHLAGTLIFLVGLLAAVVLERRRGVGSVNGALRTAVAVQSVHVLEHVALTLTAVVAGRAIGLSTFLGVVEGPAMTSFRIWFHFLINLAAVWCASKAVVAASGGRLIVQSGARSGAS